jgi:hypothetical protein
MNVSVSALCRIVIIIANDTYRRWEDGEEPLVHFASVVWLILLLVIGNERHPRVSISLGIIFDAILELADSVMRKALWHRR